MTDERAGQLQNWCAAQSLLAATEFSFRMVSGDASFRRYFRLQLKQALHTNTCNISSLIAVDAPPQHENAKWFCAIADFLTEHGVRVPCVYVADFVQGFLLMEDLGDVQLLGCLNAGNVDECYQLALDALLQLQRIDYRQAQQPAFLPVLLPDYSEQKLLDEMRLFQDWFLQKLLHMQVSAEQEALIENAQRYIANAVLQQQKVCVHRDYHSRNLMLVEQDQKQALAMIDFQDAVVGPVTYDPVSLLKDCYIEWPASRRERWLQSYFVSLQQSGVLANTMGFSEFLRDFELMGLQRHLKVLGIFARLNIRDNKPGYLQDLPLTFSYVEQALENFSDVAELSAFGEFFLTQVKPAFMAQQQEWKQT